MQTIVLHVDGRGVVWALAKCRGCGEVHKYLAAEAIADNPHCKSCSRAMDIQGAVISAAGKEPQQAGEMRPDERSADAD